MRTSARAQLLDRQRSWANAINLDLDSKGYLSALDANLYAPLSPETRAELVRGSGGELDQLRTRLPKLQALHSSAALVCNVFDSWRGRELAPLCDALGAPRHLTRMTFEEPCPTGLPGVPPQLDVMLSHPHCDDVFAIESKFTEPFSTKLGQPFKDSYFSHGESVWRQRGMTRCAVLAEAIQRKDLEFAHLDAAQLLKHCLGLHARSPGRFSLAYLYVDAPGPEGKAHVLEIERFAAAVQPEVHFVALSYEVLFERLARAGGGEHLSYLRRRYGSPGRDHHALVAG